MTEGKEHGLQIVSVTESHKYELDKDALEQLLLSEEVKDLPVVVVSVVGAYRGGKSFLLNFFLRYLTAPPSARKDGSWLDGNGTPLTGFTWRSGIQATTLGILMWSKPFITTLPSGDKAAVLLVDTQGNFDSKSTVRDNSTIFALSTLVSSVQIYNLSQNIQEDDLQHLELFTEYGMLVNAGDSSVKAFQMLEFLVRDWQFSDDYPYGTAGGESLLREKLEITPDLAKEMQDLRQHIRSSFKKVSCFLMPHPGFNVMKSTFSGNIDEIDNEFREQLRGLVNLLFSPENLLPKTINGEQVKARDLFNYFTTYMELFNSSEIASPTNIMTATVKAGFLTAVSEARDIYEKGMNSECGPTELNVPAVDLDFLHKKYVDVAVTVYTHKKKIGSAEEAEQYLEKLTKDLRDRIPQYIQSNHSKIQTAVSKAKEAYNAAVQTSNNETLCVHPLDLEAVHNVGVDAALKTYDAARKRLTENRDDERDAFIKSFKEEYELLKRINEKNNDAAVAAAWMAYWMLMQEKTDVKPPLTVNQFEDEHFKAHEQALKDFDLKRNIPSHYSEDTYKYTLTKNINVSFASLEKIYQSNNKGVMQAAIKEYDGYMEIKIYGSTKCMHPDDLEESHRVAICRALTKFRPNKGCSSGFDYNDEDETTLNTVINQRHEKFIKSNEKANEACVTEAYNEYVSSMDDLCGFSATWLLLVPYIIRNTNIADYDNMSRLKAVELFNGRRVDSGSHFRDSYRERLDQMMKTHFDNTYKSQDWSVIKIVKNKQP